MHVCPLLKFASISTNLPVLPVKMRGLGHLGRIHKARVLAMRDSLGCLRLIHEPSDRAKDHYNFLSKRWKTTRKSSNNSFLKTLSACSELGKPRLSLLVTVTATAGFLLAGPPVALDTLLAACVGTNITAWAANTFNQCWEIHLDGRMARTRNRPLPSGRLTLEQGLAWGSLCTIAGPSILLVGCNPLTAALGLANIGLYALVYTPMKTQSIFNTWVGSVVGAIPPLMGWAAAKGGLAGPDPYFAATVLYLWQFPHFFALAWRIRHDYAAAGYQMVSAFDPTGKRTTALVQRYIFYLFPLPFVCTGLGVTGNLFLAGSTALTAHWFWTSRQQRSVSQVNKSVFRVSLAYLPLVLALMVLDGQHWGDLPTLSNAIDSTGATETKIEELMSHAFEGWNRDGEQTDLASDH